MFLICAHAKNGSKIKDNSATLHILEKFNSIRQIYKVFPPGKVNLKDDCGNTICYPHRRKIFVVKLSLFHYLAKKEILDFRFFASGFHALLKAECTSNYLNLSD
jgi:hypothetical protein